MILTRYLARHIWQGAAMVLLILVCLSLFFSLIRELDDVGRGQYGMLQVAQYLALRLPSYVVDYMPLAALIGCILSLGNLAGHSELIAMQSSGLSLSRFVFSVGVSVLALALLSLLVADLVVPHSENKARQLRNASLTSSISLHSRKGQWIKDDNKIVFIEQLYPDGNARNIEIYHLNDAGKLVETMYVEQAMIDGGGWLLEGIKTTRLDENLVTVSNRDRLIYQGQLSQQLLQSLAVDPRQMATTDLYRYIGFLQQNSLDSQSESLFLWRKIYAPLGIIVMGLLAVPFVLGSQRQRNTGQRIMIGILLGLMYVVLNRLLIQMGEQLQIAAFINALLPTLFFLLLTVWLIRRKVAI